MRRCPPALGLLAILLAAASPAAADWLVTRAGGRVETKGPWQVKGKLIVFTGTDGSLASLRLAEVDLDASRKATGEAKARAEAPPAPPPPKKKLAVLTDDNFRKTAAPAPAKPAEAAAAPAAALGPVAVSSWKRAESPGKDGVEIQGTLHNETDTVVVNVALEVQLYNEAGDRVATATAVLPSNALQPRGTADFIASFPGVFAFTNVKFEPQGLPLDLTPVPEEQKPPS